jgi:predicted TIM-barrel fold metal-dependent hydrolase
VYAARVRSLLPVASLLLVAVACGGGAPPPPGAAPVPAAASGASATAVSPAPSASASASASAPAAQDPAAVRALADGWRAAHKLIDLHTHIDPAPEHVAQAIRIFDAAGVGVAVNLSGGTVTRVQGQPSELEQVKALLDAKAPGRFLEYMNLDYADWDKPDFAARAVAQVEEGARLGAAGFKEFKRLGLYLRDGKGKLIAIDDTRLDPMWKRLGELGMPVSIHVADPKAFWEPYDAHNERWTELKDHPRWWFGDPKKFPPRMDLLAALERVVARHPETTFVCVHMANNAEDLDWVAAQLDAHPNMMADVAARVPEFGRHDPDRVRAFFVKYADRILFATDFQVYERMILGSGGSGPPPTEDDAVAFYRTHWRFFETTDRDFPHMTPIQGEWTISGIHLPADVLQKVYFGNAEKLLARPLAKLRGAGG